MYNRPVFAKHRFNTWKVVYEQYEPDSESYKPISQFPQASSSSPSFIVTVSLQHQFKHALPSGLWFGSQDVKLLAHFWLRVLLPPSLLDCNSPRDGKTKEIEAEEDQVGRDQAYLGVQA